VQNVNQPVTIRCATEADLDGVVDLWHHAAGPSRHPGQRAEAEILLGRDPEALLVALTDGAVVGTLIVGWDGWRCHLYRLAVAQSARRSGIAGALAAEARRRATDHGAVRIDAMVNTDNLGAVAFWESAGFRADSHDGRWSLVV
jgi:ribosomal protein S18 acetylase RimI-like enzyme